MDAIEVSCDVTRDDWVRVNEVLVRESPSWERVAAEHRRTMRRQAYFAAPVAVLVGVMLVGGMGGGGREMKTFGGLLGAIVAAFLLWALPRVDFVSRQRRAALERVRKADLTDHIGPTTVSISPEGVVVRGNGRDLKLAWSTAAVTTVGPEYALVQFADCGGAIVPRRAFASDDAARVFVERAAQWWRAAQISPAERLTKYLADRDVACPKCGYNLRGNAGEWCPECGLKCSLERLVETGKPPRGRES